MAIKYENPPCKFLLRTVFVCAFAFDGGMALVVGLEGLWFRIPANSGFDIGVWVL